MTHTSLRTAATLALLLAGAALAAPAGATAPPPAPRNTCAGAFCATLDLATTDASAPPRWCVTAPPSRRRAWSCWPPARPRD